VNEPLGTFGGELFHLALLAIVGGISTAAAIIGWFIRRDLKRSEDKDAERGLAITALTERFEDHVRRSGLETKDIQYRMGIMATQLRREIPEANISIPEWPSR
jgi:hypothetical protein